MINTRTYFCSTTWYDFEFGFVFCDIFVLFLVLFSTRYASSPFVCLLPSILLVFRFCPWPASWACFRTARFCFQLFIFALFFSLLSSVWSFLCVVLSVGPSAGHVIYRADRTYHSKQQTSITIASSRQGLGLHPERMLACLFYLFVFFYIPFVCFVCFILYPFSFLVLSFSALLRKSSYECTFFFLFLCFFSLLFLFLFFFGCTWVSSRYYLVASDTRWCIISRY